MTSATRRVTVSVSMPSTSADKIEAVATKQGKTLSAFMREAAEKAAKVKGAASPDLRNGQ